MPHTLLLADDSVTIQRVIELTFADEDIQVIAVSNGDQAIARIEAAPPDIILADVGMPGKNGYEVAQYVKQSPRLAHIPVVLLTGAFEPVDQARATEAGCEGVLAKPFEPQLVIGRVKELLGRGAGAGHVAAAHAAPIVPAKPDRAFGSPLADLLFGSVPAPAPAAAAPRADLNNYFDRLDQAFADRTTPGAAPEAAAPPAADVDWFKTVDASSQAPAPEQWDIPAPPLAEQDLSMSSPGALVDFDQLPVAPKAAPVPPVAVASPVAPPPAPAPLPALADAFAALLAAEQNAGGPISPAHWPAAATGAHAPSEVTDDVIEEVARRVLSRMSDGVVRERVSVLVSSIAERLVKEEIERIKRSIP